MQFEERFAVLSALQIDWNEDEIPAKSLPRRRSATTEARYRYQGGLLLRRAACSGRPGKIGNAIELLNKIAPGLLPSSVRQYRAGLLQVLRDYYEAGRLKLAQAARLLRRLGLLGAVKLPHADRKTVPVRCGGGRRRGLRPEDHYETVLRLRSLGTEMARRLADLLNVGEFVGLRPWEWPNAKVEGSKLLIQSAKFSEAMGRGLVEARELDLQPLGTETIATVATICTDLQIELRRSGRSECVMSRYARLLRRHRTDPMMTLRSTRHQFRKNLQAAGWSREAMAVAMNHASSSSQHAYGRDAKGRKGLKLPGIDETVIPSVRPARPHAAARRKMEMQAFLTSVLQPADGPDAHDYSPPTSEFLIR